MSATDHPVDGDAEPLEAIVNEEEGTITVTPDGPDEIRLAATEWITVETDDVVDLRSNR